MKKRLLAAILALAFSFLYVTSAKAQDEVAVAADALVARPLCFVATIVGSAVFVVALPVAATSGSIDSTAEVLVKRPAWATFGRPLGDFSFAMTYASVADPKRHMRKAIVRSPKAQAEIARS